MSNQRRLLSDYFVWLTEKIARLRRERRRVQWRRYSATAKGRSRRIRYEATDKALARKREYDASALGRERAPRYRDHVNLMWSYDGGVGHRNRRLSAEEAAQRQPRPARDIDTGLTQLVLRVHGLLA
jgi:hypothetical protein